MAAGRAGAAAWQKRLLEQLQAAKVSLRPPVSAAANDGTSASPKEAKCIDERLEPNWIPWIIGACLAGGSLHMSLRAKTCACAPVHGRWRQAARPKSRTIFPNLRLAPTPPIWNKTMTTPATDGKMLVNALYHSAVGSGLAAGYARLSKMAIGGSPPKLDFTPCDVGMVVVDGALAMDTKDMVIKQGLIPADILK